MRSRLHLLLPVLPVLPVAVVAAASLTPTAGAEDRIWNNGLGGLFGDPQNWDDGITGVPGPDDAAIFDLAAVFSAKPSRGIRRPITFTILDPAADEDDEPVAANRDLSRGKARNFTPDPEDPRPTLSDAVDERRELDSIESALGSSSENCPVNLQLMDRVFGYCELDFEAGEAALMAAVSRHPVAVGINANKAFQLYASGIISSKDCGPAPHTAEMEIMAINHAVVVTGWGEEMVGGRAMKYWILKNSFGEGWGENGYFKLERGAHTLDREGFGTCGMYFESVYPVMDESAGADACVPGSTFRTKYYSATSAAGLGADFQAAAKAFSASGRRGAAVALVDEVDGAQDRDALLGLAPGHARGPRVAVGPRRRARVRAALVVARPRRLRPRRRPHGRRAREGVVVVGAVPEDGVVERRLVDARAEVAGGGDRARVAGERRRDPEPPGRVGL